MSWIVYITQKLSVGTWNKAERVSQIEPDKKLEQSNQSCCAL